jgi:hypothetical protein
MKLLFLTSVSQKPTQAGEEKIKKAFKTDKEEGLPASWYREQNILPPKELEDNTNGMILLTEEEFEYVFTDCVLKLDDFSSCVDDEKIGTIIYTMGGEELWVEETSEEIYNYITAITRHWTTILVNNIIYYFNFFRQ